jgi:hypothetical protein
MNTAKIASTATKIAKALPAIELVPVGKRDLS